MDPQQMDQQRRLLLAMAIMVPLALAFAWWSGRGAGTGPEGQAAADAGTPAGAQATAPTAPAVPGEVKAAPPEPAQPGEPPNEVKELTLERPAVTLTFSTRGAALVSAKLKSEKGREQVKRNPLEGIQDVFSKKRDEAPPMDLAVPPNAEAGDAPLAVAIKGPRGVEAQAVYKLEEQTPDGARFSLRRSGFEIEKELRWLQGSNEDFLMTIRVKNVGPDAAKGELWLVYPRGIDPTKEEAGSYFGGVGNQSNGACLVNDDLVRLAPKDEGVTEKKSGQVAFLGIDQQYFAGALYPLDGPMEGHCEAFADPKVRRASAFFPLELQPGQERVFKFGGYVGPKDVDILGKAPERMSALGMKPPAVAGFGKTPFPHLDQLVDYGLWAAICRVLLGVLKFFHSLTSNWGVAIILLTLMVKVALVPLSVKAMAGAEAMKKLQPKMEEIRKKYTGDRERQNIETMKLYQEAKVNPAGGCLPMLVQVPIWIALFTTLRTSYELYREPFVSPVWTDLTFRDPTYFLPIAMGVTWILTQRSQPQMLDPMQAKLMTYVMPAFFTLTMLNYPMGLSLYIATNNVLTQIQQFVLKKFMAGKKPTEQKPAEKKPEDKKPGDKNERDAGKSGRRRERPT